MYLKKPVASTELRRIIAKSSLNSEKHGFSENTKELALTVGWHHKHHQRNRSPKSFWLLTHEAVINPVKLESSGLRCPPSYRTTHERNLSAFCVLRQML